MNASNPSGDDNESTAVDDSDQHANRDSRTTGAVGDTVSAAANKAVAPDGGSRRGRSAKKKRVASVADLIGGWYGNAKTKILKAPTKPQMRAMATAWKLDETQERHLVDLASADRTLDKTRQLLLLVVGMQEGAIASTVQKFAKQVLHNHPIFNTPSFAAVFGNTRTASKAGGISGEIDVAKLIHLVMANDLRLLFPAKELGRKRKGELERCRHNAACCTLMWLYLRGQISWDLAINYLREYIWNPPPARHKTGSEMLRAVMGARDIAAASVASALVEEQLRVARAAENQATERAQNADAKLTETETELAEARGSNDVLRGKLERERRLRAEDATALKDEYQQLRGRVLRRLREEISMLEDGLHALRRDPPKVGVMMDHGERVVDGLRREMERLRR